MFDNITFWNIIVIAINGEYHEQAYQELWMVQQTVQQFQALKNKKFLSWPLILEDKESLFLLYIVNK